VCHLVPYFSGKSAGFFRLRQLLCRFFHSGIANPPPQFSPQFAPLAAAAHTLEGGGLPPLFRRQIRTPAKHPQPQLIARKQFHFDSYVNP
jgi:hypothetical protein